MWSEKNIQFFIQFSPPPHKISKGNEMRSKLITKQYQLGRTRSGMREWENWPYGTFTFDFECFCFVNTVQQISDLPLWIIIISTSS